MRKSDRSSVLGLWNVQMGIDEEKGGGGGNFGTGLEQDGQHPSVLQAMQELPVCLTNSTTRCIFIPGKVLLIAHDASSCYGLGKQRGISARRACREQLFELQIGCGIGRAASSLDAPEDITGSVVGPSGGHTTVHAHKLHCLQGGQLSNA